MPEPFEHIIIGFPLFDGYTEHGAKSILERGEIRTIPSGETVLREGDPSTEVLLVLRGSLAVFVERNGRNLPLNSQGPGTFLGELGVLCGLPRSASVQAVDESIVLQWKSPAFRSMLLSDPLLSERIFRQSLRTLIEHERTMIDQITRSQGRG
jgi:CRP-like cAMP-binding protein